MKSAPGVRLDDLNLDMLSTIFSYLPRRNDWTNLSCVNQTLYHQYRCGLLTLTQPPWPSCKALYDPSSVRMPLLPSSNGMSSPKSTTRRRRRQQDPAGNEGDDGFADNNDANNGDADTGDDDDDEDDVPDFFDDDNPHHPLQLCSFSSIAPTTSDGDGTGRQYLAVADKEGNLQLWHRCLGLIKAWNVLLDQEGESYEQKTLRRSSSSTSSSMPSVTTTTTSRTRNATIGTTKRTLRYVALKKDDRFRDKDYQPTETTITTSPDELLVIMDSEGTIKVWRIHLIETPDDRPTRPTHQVTLLQRSVGRWEPRMFVTPKGDIILIPTKSQQGQHQPLVSHRGMIRLLNATDPILGQFLTLEMDRTTHHLPIHFEVSEDQSHFLIYATKRKTPTSASVEFILQTNHHGKNHNEVDVDRGQHNWDLPSPILSERIQQEQEVMTEQHVLHGTGTYHIQCETPQILDEQIERTCAASFFHRAALSPDGKTVAVVEFGSGGGGQQPAIRGAVRLVFRNTRRVLSEERWQPSQQQPHRRRQNLSTQRGTSSSSSSGGRRCILLPSHSRYIKMSFSQDSQYLLVQFRHRARLGRSMKLYCRNLIVNVMSGRVLTSFAPFASHAKSCEYFNHGPYRQLNSVRGTKVLFVPTATTTATPSLVSVLSAGFVSVEKDGPSPGDWRELPYQHPWSTRSGASHSHSTKRAISNSAHVPGFSITNVDLNQREQTRIELMSLSVEDLVRGIQVKLHRARIPSAIVTNKGRIVDWILQLHDHETVLPMLNWASSSSVFSFSSSSLSLSSSPETSEDDAGGSGNNSISSSRRNSIDSSSSSHSQSSVISA